MVEARSYSRANYTLGDVPQFDEHGLWFFQGIGFSRAGTLKATLVERIKAAAAGCTHPELEALLHIRVHNTLLGLVQNKRIRRERIVKLYLYVSVAAQRAAAQVAKRRERMAAAAEAIEVPDTTVVEVLLELVRSGTVTIAPAVVAERLHARGVPVTAPQAEQVYVRYSIEVKKTARSRSRPSRR